ncbi:actin-related protein 5-like [Helicoverpa armigera]|uniref:actin-related protein 5-like n=1 Tax=Helicoverpa armigera TaxID=29058 RepID=UPI003082C6C5
MENILVLKDNKTVPDIVHEYSPTLKFGHIPLVIDNGSYQCRVGWSIYDEPNLIFKNLIARPRKDRCKKDAEPPATPPIQIGNDIINIEAVRFQLKTQFDKNVVTHFEAQEQVFDYIFSHLGIDSEGSVPHPIAMTEAFVTPNYCRQLCTGTTFHGDTALIVNCGYHTIHIIPVIRGQVIVDHARRINLVLVHFPNKLKIFLNNLYHSSLEWSPVHKSAKFWRENAARLNERGQELLRTLVHLLEKSSDPVVLAVACYDVGEYVRHYPRGKHIIEQLGGKQRVMYLLSHEDPNVRYEALLAVQKLMVHNWYVFILCISAYFNQK